MYDVAVLMSTYNGSSFLEEQVNSILCQEGVNVTIYIRDDGSSDETVDILKALCVANKNIHVIYGVNVGVKLSFIRLALYVYNEFDCYDGYAFSDQDDFWLPRKLYNSQSILRQDISSLVVSKFYISNESLEILGSSSYNETFDLGNLLVEGQVPGCAMHFNYKLLVDYVYIVSTERGQETYIHDYLMLILAIVKGSVVSTGYEQMHYRQHSNNVIGASKGFKSRVFRYIRYISTLSSNRTFVDESDLMYNCSQECRESKEINYALLASGTILERVKLVFSNKLYKRSFISNIVFKVLILLGFYKNVK